MIQVNNLYNNANIKKIAELGCYEVFEHQKDMSVDPTSASAAYFMQEMNFRNNSLNVQSDFGKKLWTRTSQNSPLHTGIGEGNGNPLQCSCLENPRDGGAWWAAVYGVTQSRTRLKRLSSSSSNVYWNTQNAV